MRIQRRVAYLDRMPSGYGIAWTDMNRREAVCYPMEDMRETELKCTVRTVQYAASLNGGMVVVRTPARMTAKDSAALMRAIRDMNDAFPATKLPPMFVAPHGVEFEAIPAQHLRRLGLIRIDEASRIVERVIGGRKGARYGIRSTDTTVGAADYGVVEAAGG